MSSIEELFQNFLGETHMEIVRACVCVSKARKRMTCLRSARDSATVKVTYGFFLVSKKITHTQNKNCTIKYSFKS